MISITQNSSSSYMDATSEPLQVLLTSNQGRKSATLESNQKIRKSLRLMHMEDWTQFEGLWQFNKASSTHFIAYGRNNHM